MTKRRTTLEKVRVLRDEIRILQNEIATLQEQCSHEEVSVERTPCGFNGYSTDYTTSCVCKLCDKSWYHDGWCSGEGHKQFSSKKG